jgi:hypothetical protein
VRSYILNLLYRLAEASITNVDSSAEAVDPPGRTATLKPLSPATESSSLILIRVSINTWPLGIESKAVHIIVAPEPVGPMLTHVEFSYRAR